MKFFFQKNHRLLFYTSWLLLALAQSASTELIADEAYYWVYSQFPAWGYFDHPPMIAFLVGNEGAGLSPELVRAASVRVRIPMPGRAESLNAGVAGSIALFEAVRQRGSDAGEDLWKRR